MLTVIDLGCYTHPSDPSDESTFKLIDMFHPDKYFGFDPHPGMGKLFSRQRRFHVGNTRADLFSVAAWIFDGSVSYDPSPNRPLAARINTEIVDTGDLWVPCFDFAFWLTLLDGDEIVVKMDIEGAEYKLLDHLIEQEVTDKISRLFIEWHDPPLGPTNSNEWKNNIIDTIECRVEDWH